MILEKFSIIFGENDTGKTAICDILKSVSHIKDFQKTSPALASLIIIDDNGKEKEYIYKQDTWNEQINTKTFLFFDDDFVNANVHTHGERSNDRKKGGHTQNSGELIVNLDEHANELKRYIQDEQNKLKDIKKTNDSIIKQEFNSSDERLFKRYVNIDEGESQQEINKLQIKKENIEGNLSKLRKIQSNNVNINNLSEIDKITFLEDISQQEIFTELSTRQIRKVTQDSADEKIKAHFDRHKELIESVGNTILPNYEDKNCPFCMQPLASAKEVMEYYKTVFDKTYEDTKAKFLSDIKALTDELEGIKLNLYNLPQQITGLFVILEQINNSFQIRDIYETEEKIKYTQQCSNINTSEIDALINELESLKLIERKQIDIVGLYRAAAVRMQEIKNMISVINDLIGEKNKLIKTFKDKYSDQDKITKEIKEIEDERSEISEQITFLNSGKIARMKEQKNIQEEIEKSKKTIKEYERKLEIYLSEIIPDKVINNMQNILRKSNLDFTLKHITNDSHTTDYPFSFTIHDNNGTVRDMKEGLSAGERQIISLAFFFAINDNLQNASDTILVFDDPITSLDSSNLKNLAELIQEQALKFSQVIVFTHHSLFYKYLAEYNKRDDMPNRTTFTILKNKEIFGGSFMFSDPIFNLYEEITQCGNEIKEKSRDGKLKLEEVTLKYGQLLRLAVEKFIKHDLLMWNKENRFHAITNNLKQYKSKINNMSDEDIESASNIYKYCNSSNLLHQDKEVPSSLSELMNQIDKFVNIMKKFKQ